MAAPPRSLRRIRILAVTQGLSSLGSSIATYALALAVFQVTGSTARTTLMMFAGAFSEWAVGSVAGALVDRVGARRALVAADGVALLASAAMLAFVFHGGPASPGVLVAVALGSAASAVRWPAMGVHVSESVRAEDLPRANGLLGMLEGGAGALGPALASVALASVGIAGAVAIDAASFVVALAGVLLATSSASASVRSPDALKTLHAGVSLIWRRADLRTLALYFGAANVLLGGLSALQPVALLAYAPASRVGFIASLASLGLVAGGAALSARGSAAVSPRPILFVSAIAFAFFGGAGLVPSAWWIGGCLFVALAVEAVRDGASQSFWQRAVDAHVLGRVLAARRILSTSTYPLGMAAAGPLSDFLRSQVGAHAPSTTMAALGLAGVLLSLAFIAAPAFRQGPDADRARD